MCACVSRAIDEFEPDIVHALHVEHYPALVAARERGIQSVVSCHALELRAQRVAATAFSNAARIHVVSEFTKELVHEIIQESNHLQNDSDGKTYLISPSIDVDWYRARQNGEKDISNLESGPVVTLSRLKEEYKNIETVIEAWKRLPGEITNDRELILAGDGEIKRSLERSASSGSDISFSGNIGERTKRDLLS